MRILIWMVGTALRMRDDVFCVSSIGGWSRVRIHKVGRHRTHPAWRAHNTAFAYSQTWRVRWCMRMRKRKVWLNLRICNWMVAHAQLDQCCWWLTKGDRNGQNSLQGDKNVERLLARAMYRTPCDVPATESDAHLTCCTPAKRDDVLVRRRCPSLCICMCVVVCTRVSGCVYASKMRMYT